MYAADYKKLARQKLTGNWGNAALAVLLFELLNAILSGTVIGSLLLTGTLAFGYTMFFKAIRDVYHPSLELLFRGFSVNFLSSMLASLLVALFTFLWSLLLIVPGIIKSYSYSMVFYVLDDHPEMSATEAIAESQRIMDGNKWRLFCLEISFIGWYLLSALALGIPLLWVIPWQETAKAEFYESIK